MRLLKAAKKTSFRKTTELRRLLFCRKSLQFHLTTWCHILGKYVIVLLNSQRIPFHEYCHCENSCSLVWHQLVTLGLSIVSESELTFKKKFITNFNMKAQSIIANSKNAVWNKRIHFLNAWLVNSNCWWNYFRARIISMEIGWENFPYNRNFRKICQRFSELIFRKTDESTIESSRT